MSSETELELGALALGYRLSTEQVAQFNAYAVLIHKWNKAINLVSSAELPGLVVGHFLDSLSLAPHLHGEQILDVGTGAGFPGIPLAILFPEKRFDLLDSREKRIHFLQTLVADLSLSRVRLYHARVEAHNYQACYDQITARAFSSLEQLFLSTQKLLKPGGQILAMKGKYPHQELSALKKYRVEVTLTPLLVPGLAAERHLVTIAPHVS